MPKGNDNLIPFPQESTKSVLDEVLREGARKMLAHAIEDEVTVYVSARQHLADDKGHRQVVRNGYLPERSIQTPMGAMTVQQPRVRDRRDPGERETFHSSILPP